MPVQGSVAESTADREVIVTRTIDAPARLVFEAWTKPEYIKRWFGPAPYPVTMAEMDFRVGGRYRFAMTGPNGKQMTPFGGEYLEIVPNRKIVFTDAFELPGAEEMVMHVTFDEKDGKTTVTVRTVFANLAQKATHVGAGIVEGLGLGLDQLGQVAADLLARERR